MLRQVLQEFEAANGAVSLADLSRKLNIRESLLSSMLDFWVRQGALRESGQGSCPPSCGGCAIRQGCGFKAKAYSLAAERPAERPVERPAPKDERAKADNEPVA